MADFSTALATWKDINLTELQRSLDATALELVENQKENMVGRKKLAEQTREFKKIPDDSKLDAIKSLLKAYQSEIDHLTRRSKVSESAFLNAYKLLAEAPDPYPILDAAVDQTMKIAESKVLESELVRLKEENGELKKQVGQIGKEEEKRKKAEQKAESLEEKMDELIQERVSQKENELNATYDERMRNYEEREKDLSNQVNTVKDQLRDLRTSSDSNQAKLMDVSQRADVEVVAKLGELDMIVADLERANGRVAAVERRNEILRAEIENVKSGSQYVDKVKHLESQITDLESEAARLLKTLDTQTSTSSSTVQTKIRRIEELEREVGQKQAEIEQLRGKAKQYVDYDEIKRELEIMKFVEFGGGDDANSVQLPDPNASKANKQVGHTLETLLTVKNKKIMEEMTRMRVSHETLLQTSSNLEEQLKETTAELEKQRSLNERLENDLLMVNNSGSKGKGRATTTMAEKNAAAGGAGAAGAVGGVANGGLAGLDLGGAAGEKSNVTSGRSSPIPFSSPQPDNSILPIVTSQRDRFRARNAELEEELRKQFESLSDLRTEIKSLQADNLKLYEKVRYVGSYNPASSNAAAGPSSYAQGGGGGGGGLASVGLRGGGGEDGMGRYKDKYDESLNPFEKFKGREAERAVQALNPIERAVFALCRAIIGNRRARSIFVLYAASLHGLVLVSIWSTLFGGMGSDGGISEPIRPYI